MKLKRIYREIAVNTTSEHLWEVVAQYGDVSQFHAGVMQSYKEAGSENLAAMGGERVCHVVDLGLNITLKERIVEFEEGHRYKYEVYEWKNFPIQKMLFGFTVVAHPGSTSLGIEIEYRAKPAFLTPVLAGKVKKLARDILLGYKHFAETGQLRIPIKELKKRYGGQEFLIDQMSTVG